MIVACIAAIATLAAAGIPYIEAPEYTLLEYVPILGRALKLQVFGPLVATGVLLGMQLSLRYAKKMDMDEFVVRDLIFWILVGGFAFAHWVSVIFYFPDQVRENPWVLLAFWNGLSSVGGFFGASLAMWLYLRSIKQPILRYADLLIYGLLLGWVFGRLGCALVHDHPGKVVDPGALLAVGPWPDGTYRYDLGLNEFLFTVVLSVTVYFFVDVFQKRAGWLTGLVVLAYAPLRFWLDFMRESKAARGVISSPDLRYLGLTTAQWFTIAFLLIGVWLMFLRKPRASDDAYAKDSERIAREAAAREARRAGAAARVDQARAGEASDEGADDEPDAADEPGDDGPRGA